MRAYGIREILTAHRLAEPRAGAHLSRLASSPLHERKVELLFVTLDKREGYHERIAVPRLRDQPGAASTGNRRIRRGRIRPVGRRYLESPGNGWSFQLFVRTVKRERPIAPAARLRWSVPRAKSP
jgi:hypothetical protein